MFELLEKIRARPESHRKAIAFGISAIFTFFVFIGWSSTLNLSLGPGPTGSQLANSGESTQTAQLANGESSESVSPFGTIKDSLTAAVIDFKNHLGFGAKKEDTVIDKAHNPVPGLLVNPQDIKDIKTQ